MSENCAFIYSNRFGDFCFGGNHPFKVERFALTHRLLCGLDLLSAPEVRIVEAQLADESDLHSFHHLDYLEKLKEFSEAEGRRADFRFGLGDHENPVFPGVFDWVRLCCGATLEAVRQVLDEGCHCAFNMAGGWHHAHAARASGFSYLNDAVIAINAMVNRGLRVAYIDLDAHHGDGVQEAFYRTDRVLTISLHETGKDFFPYSGFVRELGAGAGYGYTVNLPFAPHSDDLVFEQALRRVVMPLLHAYQPDVLVSQMGMDILRTDPLTRLEMTTGSVELAARLLRRTGLPWVALGGGGYDRLNTARGWTLLWAVMSDQKVADDLPEEILSTLKTLGYATTALRDEPHLAHPDDFCRAQEQFDRNLAFLERRLFPLHGMTIFGRGGGFS
ncbi:MAG: acetoin utilization protein AcuC [Syntrophotalea acetylenica]|jgi:acetoin utilization protein AcuC|uniref:Acetoin utilization protein AcuC n=2 Tax=Syntrophotalea acetylenica TaxID=29542 RepID=A0A1L3GIR0_SYNAC|nr:acetoin utilization protein AcuC [Syntrophotalea acetylenica]APG25826.1 histone deacetylase [Syntrophotalea acetylenica]MDD4456051.1 acetoin utilization protein AcuC [Syntrophotalea acetylenica]